MIQFIEKEDIIGIARISGENTCGTVSICSILKYFDITYDIKQVEEWSKDGPGRPDYPIDGSSALGIVNALNQFPEVTVSVYSNWTIDEYRKNLDSCEKPMFEIFQNLHTHVENINIYCVLDEINHSNIPIIGFIEKFWTFFSSSRRIKWEISLCF